MAFEIPSPSGELDISYDPDADLVTICGVKYAGVTFRAMALAEPGTWLRIMERKDGVITVFAPSPGQERQFDAITGLGRKVPPPPLPDYRKSK